MSTSKKSTWKKLIETAHESKTEGTYFNRTFIYFRNGKETGRAKFAGKKIVSAVIL